MRLELVVDEADLPWRPTDEWERRAQALVSLWGPGDGLLQLVLTDDATVRELNLLYRGQDRPTDVLSFPYLQGHLESRELLLRGEAQAAAFADDPGPQEEVLVGQILVSLPEVWRRGALHAEDLPREILFLLAHGLLHVLGYDHLDDPQAEEMEGLEMELMASLSAADGGERA